MYSRNLRFEQCEDRRLLAVFSVTNTNDGVVTGPGDQPGTLRQAIFDANFESLGPDTIEFDLPAGSTITLSEGQLTITDAVTIDATLTGLDWDTLTIDANGGVAGDIVKSCVWRLN